MAEKVLVVTGGSRGIGAATCLLGAERGYAVVVNYAGNVEAAERVCAQIIHNGGKAIAVRGTSPTKPMSSTSSPPPTASALLRRWSTMPASLRRESRVEDMDAERINRVLAVNVTGSFLCAKAAIKRMSTRHGGTGGAIVNLASGAAKVGSPAVYVDYAAAKGAIDSFTIGLALELAAEGIRVNAVRPGIIETDIHASGGDPDRATRMAPTLPIPRAGTPEEVARAILWLLSDEASYTIGTIIAVTGGRAIQP